MRARRWYQFWRRAETRASADPLDDRWYQPVPAGWIVRAERDGLALTPELALNLSAIWRGLRVYGDQIGSLACHVYERVGDGRRRAPEHPLYALLRWQPNAQQTAFEFWETVIAHVLLWSHAYVEILSTPTRYIDQLVPRHPARMQMRTRPDGGWSYEYTDQWGRTRVLRADQVMHIRGFGIDDYALPMTAYAARSLQTAVQTERFAERFFRRGVSAAIAVIHPQTLGSDGLANLRETVRAYATGSESHGVLALEEDVKVQALGIDPEKGQMLAAREFSIAEIARWLNLPPYVLGDTKATTYASAYEFRRDLVDFSLRPMAVRIEQAIQRDLIIDRDRYYAEFLFDALARADLSTRAEYYGRATGGAAWMSVNEVRERENLNPIPDGDEIIQPLNLGAGMPAARMEAITRAAIDRWLRREQAMRDRIGGNDEALRAAYDREKPVLCDLLGLSPAGAEAYVTWRRAQASATIETCREQLWRLVREDV